MSLRFPGGNSAVGLCWGREQGWGRGNGETVNRSMCGERCMVECVSTCEDLQIDIVVVIKLCDSVGRLFHRFELLWMLDEETQSVQHFANSYTYIPVVQKC